MAMPSIILEQMGYLLWEGLLLLCIFAVSLTFVILRRKISGKDRGIKQDWKSLFNGSSAPSKPQLCLRLALAVLLFSCIGTLEVLAIAQLGAALLSVSLIVSCAGIVNIILL
jgi:hypothetical protein